jgi:hypothetical protein
LTAKVDGHCVAFPLHVLKHDVIAIRCSAHQIPHEHEEQMTKSAIAMAIFGYSLSHEALRQQEVKLHAKWRFALAHFTPSCVMQWIKRKELSPFILKSDQPLYSCSSKPVYAASSVLRCFKCTMLLWATLLMAFMCPGISAGSA